MQAAAQANLIRPRYTADVRRPCERKGKPATDPMGEQERWVGTSGVFGGGMYPKNRRGTWETRQGG